MMGGAASSWAGSGFSGGFKSWILSDKNVDKLAEHLLKMRGAALLYRFDELYILFRDLTWSSDAGVES